MDVNSISSKIPTKQFDALKKYITIFRPAQIKAIEAGLLDYENLLVCTPTASGKTLIAELAMVKNLLECKGKAVYIVPLRALANEKYRDFLKRHGEFHKIALSIGDMDKSDSYLSEYDIIITTSEKLDSLIRHGVKWINEVGTLVIDEVHLLNDVQRGPTLEILITMLRRLINAQIIALSATIGNSKELADWLGAKLVVDDWRPVELKKGISLSGKVEFYQA